MGDTLPLQGGGMPWKECHVMDERLRFVARLLDGEKMADVCATSSGSRARPATRSTSATKHIGVHGLTDRSRRPYRHANQLPDGGRKADRPAEEGVSRIGARRRSASASGSAGRTSRVPAISTVHAVLDRHGLVRRRRRPPTAAADRHAAVAAARAERAVVRGLQRRVPARQSPVLLSADDHRFCQPLSDGV